MQAQKNYASFTTRPARSQYVLEQFGDVLKGKILDVGCYEAPLRELLPNEEYWGIDIVGKPDQVVNLEECERLPFEDKSYDCVMCIEVLEHLNNLHAMFADLFRVSNKYVIVSLPNCWCGARGKLAKGRGEILHYGLPLEKPLDRHKWFINVSQVSEFFQRAHPKNFVLKDLRVVEKPRNPLLTATRKLRFSRDEYNNRYSHTIFSVFERQSD
ncbi:class I SAM-dependent methyltransferase [Rubinisphaera brasiliensis]|uniref:Methyltransferase type 11 n=1 Tax=Rubinisphaera brasiliensis (strain ATCC 49424 / DSM 5305 / JCM 21570 / IAM 15109 / NBRC 103401 / IFAM 1448) TaxID=756272 RepID=F0SFT2_RUBBR|nr:class I SAM-dependent methyltransferase [Rubinisphaera brasiliensis]ADY61539.1 Methyltransferase type 11 [Rubinisphaera brasiliensis DSM 5305]